MPEETLQHPPLAQEHSEALDLPEVEALVVLGKSFRAPSKRKQGEAVRDQHDLLSIESKFAAIAAGMMYLEDKTKKIIFTGGKVAGENWLSEAEAMRTFMQKVFRDPGSKDTLIPEDDVIIEEAAMDTSENARQVRIILEEEYPAQKPQIALMTVGFHVERAKKQFAHEGIEGEWLSSEQIIKHRSNKHQSKHYQHLVKKYHGSKRVMLEEIREMAALALQAADPDGNISRWLAKTFRGKSK